MDNIQQLTLDFNEPTPHLCECGCGRVTTIARKTYTHMGVSKGQPNRFLPGHQPSKKVTRFCAACGKAFTRVVSQVRTYYSPICSQVGRTKTLESRFWAKVNKDGPIPAHRPELGPCWLWMGSTVRGGYGRLNDGRSGVNTHRLSFELCVGAIPDGLDVLHKCDNPPCCNPEHLFPGTDQDNANDKVEKGRSPNQKGAANGNARLSPEDVLLIRRLLSEGQPAYTDLAKRFDVTPKHISLIAHRKLWPHI